VTASDLVIAAIQRLTGDNSLPSPDDTAMALSRLNDLIDQWSIEGLMITTLSRVTWTITGASSYTVGLTGTIVIDRPSNAEDLVFALLDNSQSPPLEIGRDNYTEAQYQAIPQKTLTATWPLGFYYNPTTPLGTLTPWPVPTGSSLQGVMYAANPAGELALTDVLTLASGSRRLYRDRLAMELAADFNLPIPAAIAQAAADATAVFKRSNIRMVELGNEAASLGGATKNSGWLDIYSGSD